MISRTDSSGHIARSSKERGSEEEQDVKRKQVRRSIQQDKMMMRMTRTKEAGTKMGKKTLTSSNTTVESD